MNISELKQNYRYKITGWIVFSFVNMSTFKQNKRYARKQTKPMCFLFIVAAQYWDYWNRTIDYGFVAANMATIWSLIFCQETFWNKMRLMLTILHEPSQIATRQEKNISKSKENHSVWISETHMKVLKIKMNVETNHCHWNIGVRQTHHFSGPIQSEFNT